MCLKGIGGRAATHTPVTYQNADMVNAEVRERITPNEPDFGMNEDRCANATLQNIFPVMVAADTGSIL